MGTEQLTFRHCASDTMLSRAATSNSILLLGRRTFTVAAKGHQALPAAAAVSKRFSGVDVNFFSTKEERPSSAFSERQRSTGACGLKLRRRGLATATEQAEVDAKAEEAQGGGLAHRLAITAEVTVSKIFP